MKCDFDLGTTPEISSQALIGSTEVQLNSLMLEGLSAQWHVEARIFLMAKVS